MRGRILWFLLAAALALPVTLGAASGKVLKVFPQYLDLRGRHALAPSLFERDAYQARLRKAPAERGGMRLVVEWKGKATAADKPLFLKVEMRGLKGESMQTITLGQDVSPAHWFGSWSEFRLTGVRYKEFGELVAWRATLWEGETQLSTLESFLWSGVLAPAVAHR